MRSNAVIMFYDEFTTKQLIENNIALIIHLLPDELIMNNNDKIGVNRLKIQQSLHELIYDITHDRDNKYLNKLKTQYEKLINDGLVGDAVFYHLLNETTKLIGLLRIAQTDQSKDNLLTFLYQLKSQLNKDVNYTSEHFIDDKLLNCVSYCEEIKNNLLLQNYQVIPNLLNLLYLEYKQYKPSNIPWMFSTENSYFFDLEETDETDPKIHINENYAEVLIRHKENLEEILKFYEYSLKWL